MNLKFGILQGRLSNAPNGRLQFYPKDYNSEFKVAKDIGFHYLEMFTERKYNKKNPIWTNEGISSLKNSCVKKNKLYFYSFVDDYILKNKIDKKLHKYYQNLILNLKNLKIKILTIPFYGINRITKNNYKEYLHFINFLCKECTRYNINLCIESNMAPDLFLIIQKIIKKNLYFTFDTGNRILLNRNLNSDFLALKKYVKHIHIKDKDIKKKNVQLGRGMVNFKEFFLILKKINYNKSLTLETTRGKNAIMSASKNLKFIKKYIN